ncbi:MAG: hypothetical protein LBB45_00285 [Methanobrevibacter sp.]|jgi:uncharacterized Fe-S center protein|nr:hypothetical protein [Candidatus Methanovirga basalitermitum]
MKFLNQLCKIISCTIDAIDLNWRDNIPLFIERMGEYVLGAVENKQSNSLC